MQRVSRLIREMKQNGSLPGTTTLNASRCEGIPGFYMQIFYNPPISRSSGTTRSMPVLKSLAILGVYLSLALRPWTTSAQIDPTLPSASQSADTLGQVQQVGPPGQGAYAVTEAGPNHRRLSRIDQTRGPDGRTITTTNSYVQLASGLNRLDSKGRWVAAQPIFSIVNGKAVATNTAHTVILTSPTDVLPVDVLTPDGNRGSVGSVWGLVSPE
jgi:hypothetical protein